MSVTDELVSNNESYSAQFDKGDLPLPPAKKVAVRRPAWTRGSIPARVARARGGRRPRDPERGRGR